MEEKEEEPKAKKGTFLTWIANFKAKIAAAGIVIGTVVGFFSTIDEWLAGDTVGTQVDKIAFTVGAYEDAFTGKNGLRLARYERLLKNDLETLDSLYQVEDFDIYLDGEFELVENVMDAIELLKNAIKSGDEEAIANALKFWDRSYDAYYEF